MVLICLLKEKETYQRMSMLIQQFFDNIKKADDVFISSL